MRALIYSILAAAAVGAVAIPTTNALFVETAGMLSPMTATVHAAAQDGDFAERDEIRQSIKLSAGADVEVRGINGSVTIETGSSDTAEVYIVRSARRKDDLNYHRVFVEGSGSRLVIRGEDDRNGGRGREVRQRVELRLPRQINLSVSGVNGRVDVGEIEGTVRASGINGAVNVAHATSTSDISGINGKVTMAFTRLDPRGLTISGINGKVELQFAEDVNADLDVSGINGAVIPEINNVTIQGKVTPNSFRAKIGAGGPRISVSGVNGNVRLTRAASM
jgi:hypothetical protein